MNELFKIQNIVPTGNGYSSACKICGARTSSYGHAAVRARFQGTFLRCDECGFLFVDRPEWLNEAYAEAINISDTGYVSRNLSCQARTQMLIEMFLNPAGRFLDFAAGYGMFVRLMRDQGYDFRWCDPYCQNLFAPGFEAELSSSERMEAITAFEVFEHLSDPIRELELIAKATDNVIFTTALIPEPAPRLDDWWYFGLEHGQHVSFYTAESLKRLAARFGYRLLSDGEAFHMYTRTHIRASHFKRIDSQWWRRWIRTFRRRQPLTYRDREILSASFRPRGGR